MLLLCVARQDLLDIRPGWGGGKLNATTMLLEALTEGEAEELVDNVLSTRIDAAMRTRIATAAEGNPLFVEEMLAMVLENGDAEIAVPPTIQALLAARGSTGSRRTSGRPSNALRSRDRTTGRTRSPISSPRRWPVAWPSSSSRSCARTSYDRSATCTFRFKHLLLRDAAYEALPKEQRAELHERFADWMESSASELEEIRGYHLEQAYRYRGELGPVDEAGHALARRASALLAAAGRRARDRADVPATTNLLERAVPPASGRRPGSGRALPGPRLRHRGGRRSPGSGRCLPNSRATRRRAHLADRATASNLERRAPRRRHGGGGRPTGGDARGGEATRRKRDPR